MKDFKPMYDLPNVPAGYALYSGGKGPHFVAQLIFLIFIGVFCLLVTGCGLLTTSIPQGEIMSPTELDAFIEVEGINHHYRSYPGNGEQIVLLHGFASSTYTWEDVAPHLQAEGHHVWALDMKGFGWSDKPQGAQYDPVSLQSLDGSYGSARRNRGGSFVRWCDYTTPGNRTS